LLAPAGTKAGADGRNVDAATIETDQLTGPTHPAP